MEPASPDRLNGEMSIAEIVRAYPETHHLFHGIGLHVCHYGRWTLQDACRDQGMPLDVVLTELRRVLGITAVVAK
ncbi:MAG: DUF542 domain-containing protein [Planctomycetes bacterium]|nr:DUF542 domain-containing protein [Planctomycetota bacterium]